MSLSEDLIKERCERSYYFFVQRAFKVLEPKTDFKDNWHIKFLCDRLQHEVERIAKGKPKTKDLIINIPPRTMKSLIVTVFLNAWTWTKYPEMRFICASYSASLAEEHSQLTRDVIQSSWYSSKWGDICELKESTKSKFSNTATGRRASVGMGGSTGKGANILIVDDPLNPKQAVSDIERTTANDLYKSTLYNRVNNPRVGLRIIIMQRLHSDDLTGHLLRGFRDFYDHINFPAEENDKIRPIECREKYTQGVLWSNLFPINELMKLKANMSDNRYAGQYLQAPVLVGSRVWEPSWFKEWTNEFPSNVEAVVLSWDTAFKVTKKSDYSSCSVWLVCPNLYILIHVFRKKLKFPDLKEANKMLCDQYKPTNILIEDAASGQSMIQEVIRDSEVRASTTAMKPSANKLIRADIVSPILQQGKVWYYNGNWVKDFIEEVEDFPNGAHDDQVDSVSQFLIWITQLQRKSPQLR